MKPSFRNIFLSKYALVVWAIVLVVLSVVFNKVYTTWSSVNQEMRQAEQYIARHQLDFEEFVTNTSFIDKLVSRRETLPEFNEVIHKPYGIFIYSLNQYGNPEMKFWSDQQALPSPETLVKPDGEYFEHLQNGFYLTVKKVCRPVARVLSRFMR